MKYQSPAYCFQNQKMLRYRQNEWKGFYIRLNLNKLLAFDERRFHGLKVLFIPSSLDFILTRMDMHVSIGNHTPIKLFSLELIIKALHFSSMLAL